MQALVSFFMSKPASGENKAGPEKKTSSSSGGARGKGGAHDTDAKVSKRAGGNRPLLGTVFNEAALARGIREEKLVMIFVSTMGCKPCLKIKRALADLLLKHRQVYAMHVDVAHAISWCDTNDIVIFPTFLFFANAVPLPALTVRGAHPDQLADSLAAISALQ